MLEKLRSLGADIDTGLRRFMGDEVLYTRMLKMFPGEAEKDNSIELIDKGQLQEAAAVVHTMKGLTGNLSLDVLYESYTEALRLLRDNNVSGARVVLLGMGESKAAIVACLREEG